jgi:hypothetical protein
VTRSTALVTAAVVLVLVGVVPSQSRGSDGFRFGLKLGWPWSWISYDGPWGRQDTDTDTRIFSGGVVLEFPLRDSATPAIVSGVTYVVKSGDSYDGAVKFDSPIGMLTLDWDCYYLAVPVMVKHSFATGGVRPYVAGGGEIAFPMKAELSSYTYPTSGEPATGGTRDVTDDMRVVEFSLAAVGGLEFPIGSGSGFVEVVYAHGLTDVWKSDLGEVRFRTLTLSGGVMF